MRKIKLFALATLLTTVGSAWAQPTVTNEDVTQISTDKYYYLWNNGRSGYMNISYSFTTGAKRDVQLSNSIGADNWVKYIVRFEADGENYRVKFFDGSYLTTANSSDNVQTSDDVNNAVSVSATYDDTNKWALKNLTNNLYFNGNASTFCYWGNSQDTGNGKYFIREVNVTAEEFAAAKVEAQPQDYFSTSYADAKWFNMTIRNYSNFVAYSETEPYDCHLAATEAQRASDAYKWALIGNATDGVQVVNKATGAGYTLTNNGGNAVLREGSQKWVINDNGDGFVLNIEGSNAYINDVNGKFQFWDDNAARTDAGSTMHFLPAPSIPIVDVTYRVLYNDNEVASATIAAESGSSIPAIPAELQRDYLTLSYDNTIIATADLTVNVTATWNGPALSADVASANWQNLAIRGNWYVTSNNVDGDGALKTVNANALGLVEDDYQWALVGDPYHIQLFNKAKTNNFGYSDAAKVNSGIPAFQDATSYWTLKQGTSDLGGFVLFAEGTNLQINQYGGEGGSLKFWQNGATNDAGSAFTIFDVPTDFSSYAADLAPYFEPTGYFSLKQELKNAAGWDAALKTACTFEQYKKLRDAVDALTYPDSYVLPETGYYRLKNNNYDSYMGLKSATVYGNYTAEADVNGATTIVKLTKNENSEYAIAIQDQYLQALTQSANVSLAAAPAFFKPGIQTPGQVSFSVSGEGFTYTHCAEGGAVVGWVLNAAASLWTLEDVTSINVALTESDGQTYATLCVPFGVTLPENVDAYVISNVGDRAQTAKLEVKDIPAGTAVILRGESGVTSITATIKNDIDTFEGTNALQGTYTEKALGADDLVLGISTSTGIGFYKKAGKNPVLGANKAYLTISSGSPVKSFALSFDNETGISSTLNVNATVKTMYDLSGRAVNGSAQRSAQGDASHLKKGIYIMDGKKVLVK